MPGYCGGDGARAIPVCRRVIATQGGLSNLYRTIYQRKGTEIYRDGIPSILPDAIRAPL